MSIGRGMHLAVLADVHANLPALEAVLADVDRVTPAGIWVAGDLIGYNPDADELLEILRDTHLPMARPFRSGLMVNPGSVGQPRDSDPRAAWGLLDLTRRTFAVRRVPYDIDAVATAIKRNGLPTELADRLYTGV